MAAVEVQCSDDMHRGGARARRTVPCADRPPRPIAIRPSEIVRARARVCARRALHVSAFVPCDMGRSLGSMILVLCVSLQGLGAAFHGNMATAPDIF